MKAPVAGGFTYVERIHSDIDGAGSFGQNQEAAQWLKSRGETGFTGVLLTDRRERLSPEWLDVSRGWVSQQTGDCVIAGTISHTAFGLDSVYDMGARDGRNYSAPDWGPQKGRALFHPPNQLFVGNGASGIFQMGPVGGDVRALAVDPTGTWFATLESDAIEGHPNTLWVGEVAGDGSRRYLGAFDYAQDLKFSPDGRWLAMSFGYWGIRVVDVESGKFVALAADMKLEGHAEDYRGKTGWDWWPGESPRILVLMRDGGKATSRLVLLDVLTSEIEDLGQVSIQQTPEAELSVNASPLLDPAVSPDGSEVLVRTTAWSFPGRESEFDERDNLAMINLTDLTVEPLMDTFVDGWNGPFPSNSLTREQEDCRWLGTATVPAISWRIDPALAQQIPARDVALDAPPSARLNELYAGDFFATVALLVEYSRGEPAYSGPGPGRLLPEIVRLLIAAKEYSDRFEELDDFVYAVCMKPVMMEGAGRPRIEHYDDYRLLGSAAEKVRFDRTDQIDWPEFLGG